tara:strand:- start:596 stop:1189 length:594 start_codon:yes stop_codon:yes gene_type:complete
MKKNIKTLQISIISFAFLLIIVTYFYIPKIEERKLEEKNLQKNEMVESSNEKAENLFEKVTYEGIYQIENPFVIKAEKAKILSEEPSIVHMNSMKVTITLKSGEIVMITSDAGRYDKINYDIFFEGNVKAIHKDTELLSDNLDLLSDQHAKIYNNVVLEDKNTGYLKADLIKYDFDSKKYKISMYENKKKIKAKLIE